MKPENFRNQEQRNLLLPKWAVPIVWAVIVLLIQVLLPWAVAKIGPRWGWSRQNPSWWNFTGLIAVSTGIGLYAWCLFFHFKTYRTSVRVGFSPPHLVTAGPYQISRNPMYISAFFAWIGWAIFYGSPLVFIALLLLWSIFSFRVIPQEERQLESLFGEDYLDYQRSVRRWIGRY
jgi:protein-S-isoprenylcysteine O-methyltransferase Ste14